MELEEKAAEKKGQKYEEEPADVVRRLVNYAEQTIDAHEHLQEKMAWADTDA